MEQIAAHDGCNRRSPALESTACPEANRGDYFPLVCHDKHTTAWMYRNKACLLGQNGIASN
jgi:hypothetical protein